MHRVRTTLISLAASVALSGCSRFFTRHDVTRCSNFAIESWKAFDSTAARSLAGTYNLIVISENVEEFNRAISGPLRLAAADPARAFVRSSARPSESTDHAILWGSAHLEGDRMTIPWQADPSSTDPSRPGVIVYQSGVVALGPSDPAAPDGGVTMHIERVSSDGFSGTWTAGDVSTIQLDGAASNDPPHGRFCARAS
jgi:hypothetical protein